MKYVLTGATGGLGSQVLKHLLRLVPPSDIIVSLHNPHGATPEMLAAGVEVRHGDFSAPATLDAAFAGGTALLLVSYPSVAHALRVKHHAAAIDAARRCGIARVYYTSLAFGAGSVAAVMQAHLDTEAYLRASGLAYTILREGIYSESFPLYLGFFDPRAREHEVCVPADGPVAWVCREDLGEGTARIMAAVRRAPTPILARPHLPLSFSLSVRTPRAGTRTQRSSSPARTRSRCATSPHASPRCLAERRAARAAWRGGVPARVGDDVPRARARRARWRGPAAA
ncbi:hypothetical protein AcV7_000025 [Taiwanofungus camphoratus]|nr:hypothetical protein AcV7_000025 [Antrodia cinnamomea]